jgi:hypothetical protein
MSFFIQLLEAFAVLVPDLLTLGLVTSAFFSLCCIARTLGIAGAVDNDLPFKISLALGYLLTIAINMVGSPQAPSRSTITISSPPESRVEQAGHESLSGTRKAQPVGREGAVIES